MDVKVLAIAIIRNGDLVLMRKKPSNSPYRETWYLFGADVTRNKDIDSELKRHIKSQTGIDIEIESKFSWDSEVKEDTDRQVKQFFYLDTLCKYVGGELTTGSDIEKLKWVKISDLATYDIVPPSRIVFKKLKYIA
jgi:ADP-ribose pyrophosphatase YjhB (NUDIX family)